MNKAASAIREKEIAQLYKEVDTLLADMREIRFRHAHREMKDTTKHKKLKRQVARIMTIIREKEVANLELPTK